MGKLHVEKLDKGSRDHHLQLPLREGLGFEGHLHCDVLTLQNNIAQVYLETQRLVRTQALCKYLRWVHTEGFLRAAIHNYDDVLKCHYSFVTDAHIYFQYFSIVGFNGRVPTTNKEIEAFVDGCVLLCARHPEEMVGRVGPRYELFSRSVLSAW